MPVPRSDRASGAFAVRPFRWLFVAGAQSQVGDQIGRVALSVLVFERTGSALATAAAFALTFLPSVLGSGLLGWVADRWERRSVLIAADVVRAILFVAMAVPGVPLVALYLLLAAAALLEAPYSGAETALVAGLVPAHGYASATAALRSADQIASLLGYGVGGLLVAVTNPRTALAVNAASFAVSALLLVLRVPPSAALVVGSPAGARGRTRAAAREIAARPDLAVLLGLACAVGFYIAPETLAAPLATDSDGPSAVGVLMAAVSGGVALGNLLIVRLSETARQRSVGLLAVAAGIPLLACAARPSLPLTVVLFALAGMAASYLVVATTTFTLGIPDHIRGTAVSLAAGCLITAQGLVAILAGVLAQQFGAGPGIAACAAIGMVIAAPLAVAHRRLATASGRAQPGRHRRETAADPGPTPPPALVDPAAESVRATA